MLFKSKMIRDPDWTTRDNNMGLTVGLTFHTPKFWDCSKYSFYSNQFDEMRYPRLLTEKELEYRYRAKLAHVKCKRKHMSYRGYMYWVGPKRRYELRYMGATNPPPYGKPWWKPFSIYEHNRYVRWFDNGPQHDPKPDFTEHIEFLEAHNQKFREALAFYETQMEEYARVRSANGGHSR